jgi:hypothetical protein
MRVLLEAPGEEFFSSRKQKKSWNKPIEELSPYAKEFFKTFLRTRADFEPPYGKCYFLKFNNANNVFGSWPNDSWRPDGRENITLGVIDFRFVPGFCMKDKSTVSKPYFDDFMRILMFQTVPSVSDVPVWLFISGDAEADAMVTALAQSETFSEEFNRHRSVYKLGKFERLGDYTALHKLAKDDIRIIWLLKKSSSLRVPPKEFIPPDGSQFQKPRKYNELEYRLFPTELRMEFYFRVLDLYCRPGDGVLSVFTGTKMVTTAVVSICHASSLSMVVYLNSF